MRLFCIFQKNCLINTLNFLFLLEVGSWWVWRWMVGGIALPQGTSRAYLAQKTSPTCYRHHHHRGCHLHQHDHRCHINIVISKVIIPTIIFINPRSTSRINLATAKRFSFCFSQPICKNTEIKDTAAP